MNTIDDDEAALLDACEKCGFRSIATREELARYRSVARLTGMKDKRVNIRLSSGDLSDIQVRALEEGVPYQALIASVLHKYVTGQPVERAPGTAGSGD